MSYIGDLFKRHDDNTIDTFISTGIYGPFVMWCDKVDKNLNSVRMSMVFNEYIKTFEKI